MGVQESGSSRAVKGTDVYSFLWRGITTGRYAPRQRLSERELADELKGSRTPVREALRLLIQDGLVTHEPRMGYRVIQISEDLVRNIMEIREVLECLAARLASRCHSPSIATAMEKTIEQGRRSHDEGQLSGLITANQQFHSLLVEGSKNSFLVSMYRTLQAYIGLMMSVSLSWPRRPAKTLEEHKEIIEALKGGNPRKAEKVVRIHIRKASRGVLRNVKQYVRQDMGEIRTHTRFT